MINRSLAVQCAMHVVIDCWQINYWEPSNKLLDGVNISVVDASFLLGFNGFSTLFIVTLRFRGSTRYQCKRASVSQRLESNARS